MIVSFIVRVSRTCMFNKSVSGGGGGGGGRSLEEDGESVRVASFHTCSNMEGVSFERA